MSEADRERWDARYRAGAYGSRRHPSAVLERWLPRLELPDRPRVLDVACGAGRNSCFLAQALAGQQPTVTGVDVSAAGLELAADRSLSDGLPVAWVRADLEAGWQAAGLSTAARFDLIVVVRYLNLPLLTELCGLLAPGGWMLSELHARSAIPVGGPGSERFRVAPEDHRAAVAGLVQWSAETGQVRDPDGRLMALSRSIARYVPG